MNLEARWVCKCDPNAYSYHGTQVETLDVPGEDYAPCPNCRRVYLVPAPISPSDYQLYDDIWNREADAS